MSAADFPLPPPTREESRQTAAPLKAGNRLSSGIKFVLLAAVLLVTVSLVVHLLPDATSETESAAVAASRARTSDSMERPILTRTDAQGRLFTVSAASATRTCAENSARHRTIVRAIGGSGGQRPPKGMPQRGDCQRQDAVSLQEVRADAAFDSPFQEDDRMFLSAASALLRADIERLELFAPMNLVTTSNYRMQAEWLGVDLKQSRIEEGRDISLEGPGASLRAETMSTSADGNMLTFRGNVRMRWH